ADYDGDGRPDLLFSGTPRGVRLLHNDDGRRFTDLTERAGLAKDQGSVQGMAFGDYDNDGDLDLAVSLGDDFHDVVRTSTDGAITFAFFAHGAPAGFDFDGAADVALELLENGTPAAPDRVRCGATPSTAPGTVRCPADAAAADTMPPGDLGFVVWRDREARAACPTCAPTARW